MTPFEPTPLTYADAGVSIDAGNRLVERIKPVVEATRRAGMLTGIGGFGGLFALPSGYRQPILVSSTDGVGTKLKLAIDAGCHDHIGVDLVAMCANDVVVCGAEPLFFLDYYATGRLDVDTAAQVIASIGRGCEQAHVALIGGETAEMPGVYSEGDYDLAGFCVGIVERDRLIDGTQVAVGDVLIGLASSGVHANGFSLVRRVLAQHQIPLDQPFGDSTLAAALLAPTRIYVRPLLSLMKSVTVKAMAHITGGGLLENVPRVLPQGTVAHLDPQSWPRPALFAWLQQQGPIPAQDMWRTFNCGVGLVVCVAKTDVNLALDVLTATGERPFVIGDVRSGQGAPQVIGLDDDPQP